MHMKGLGPIRYIHISLFHFVVCVTTLAGRACTCYAMVLKLEDQEGNIFFGVFRGVSIGS